MAAAEEPPLPDDNAPTSSGVLIASLLRYLEAADGEATVCFFLFFWSKKNGCQGGFPNRSALAVVCDMADTPRLPSHVLTGGRWKCVDGKRFGCTAR